MSHPQLVEAIESEFHPVVVYNNQPGKDAEILKKFREPAWNYQVIRFLDEEGKDIIPRKDRVWTLEGVAGRMREALEAIKKEPPAYLKALSAEAGKETGTAAFAMFCFWTGERKLGAIDGVLTTEAGWLEGREVTLVTFDRSRLSFAKLLAAAVSHDCARKVFTRNPADAALAKESRLLVGNLTEEYRKARLSDQKRQLGGTPFAKLDLSPVQATKVNAFARVSPKEARRWLSPSQLAELDQR